MGAAMIAHENAPELTQVPDWTRKLPGLGRDLNAIKQPPLRHNIINLLAVSGLWGGIFGIIALGSVLPTLVYVPVFGPLLGCLFFGHFVLIIHECSHDMLYVSRNRARQKAVNRLIGRIAGRIFFTDYLVHWEKGHRVHHLHPNTHQDRQAINTYTGPKLFKSYLKLMVPGSFLMFNPSNQYGFSLKRLLGGAMFWGPFLAAGYLLGGLPTLGVMYIALQVLSALNLTKKAQEHGGGLSDEPWPILQSRTYFYPLQWLTSPFCINYHFEHHANFSVPWYLLPTYHERVEAAVPAVLRPYYFHHEFFQQLSGKKPLPPRELLAMSGAELEALQA
ncbi:MAG: fatty acid desaturase [Myxococcota bacterium]|jgi:fatty acid desaturase